MADGKPYEGTVLQGVDPKGRVAIPADFRDNIEKRSGERMVVVGFHPTLPCLRAYDVDYSVRAEARLQRLEDDGVDAAEVARAREETFGDVERAGFDPAGRFIIPDFFREEANIAVHAVFVGAGPYFNIWDPETYVAHAGTTDRQRRRCRSLMAGKKGRA